jgi:hypothetical protein
VSDVEVRHRPTGARIWTYRYEAPTVENIAGGHWVNWDRAGDAMPDGAEYERSDVERVAIEILAELGQARESKRAD